MELNAIDLISLSVPVTDLGKRTNDVLNTSQEFMTNFVPVIDSGKFLGLIDSLTLKKRIFSSDLVAEDLVKTDIFIYFDTPIFDVIDFFIANNCEILPVLNENDDFLGCIDSGSLLNAMANTLTYKIPGSVITIEVPVGDYSISEICNIVESEKVAIVGLLINDDDLEDNSIEVILKLNNKNIDRIIASLERFNYKIKSFYSAESSSQDKLREHYDALMHYLNV